jgi:hypothetical protein
MFPPPPAYSSVLTNPKALRGQRHGHVTQRVSGELLPGTKPEPPSEIIIPGKSNMSSWGRLVFPYRPGTTHLASVLCCCSHSVLVPLLLGLSHWDGWM